MASQEVLTDPKQLQALAKERAGIEDIVTNNPVWLVFSFIKKNTPNFVQFYKLPQSKLQGTVTRLEI